MSDDVGAEKDEVVEESCAPCEKGTTNLLIGGGFGAYGTTMVLTIGYACPICMVATPLFLGMGAVQRFKYLKNKSVDNSDEGGGQ